MNNRYNLKENFTILEFNATSFAYRRVGRNHTLIMDGNKPKKFEVKRTVGCAKMSWLEEKKLNEHSHPVEWLHAALLTKERNLNGSKKSLFEKWTTYTNMKALLANAGQQDSL